MNESPFTHSLTRPGPGLWLFVSLPIHDASTCAFADRPCHSLMGDGGGERERSSYSNDRIHRDSWTWVDYARLPFASPLCTSAAFYHPDDDLVMRWFGGDERDWATGETWTSREERHKVFARTSQLKLDYLAWVELNTSKSRFCLCFILRASFPCYPSKDQVVCFHGPQTQWRREQQMWCFGRELIPGRWI